jgi:hypothetical protein
VSLALSLFNLTSLWAGFAKRFNHGFYVNAFPKRLLPDCMLLIVVIAAQWNYSPIIWLLPHPCVAAKANVGAFNRHILTAINAAME